MKNNRQDKEEFSHDNSSEGSSLDQDRFADPSKDSFRKVLTDPTYRSQLSGVQSPTSSRSSAGSYIATVFLRKDRHTDAKRKEHHRNTNEEPPRPHRHSQSSRLPYLPSRMITSDHDETHVGSKKYSNQHARDSHSSGRLHPSSRSRHAPSRNARPGITEFSPPSSSAHYKVKESQGKGQKLTPRERLKQGADFFGKAAKPALETLIKDGVATIGIAIGCFVLKRLKDVFVTPKDDPSEPTKISHEEEIKELNRKSAQARLDAANYERSASRTRNLNESQWSLHDEQHRRSLSRRRH
ncbi:hypothetical protein N431DRAFT_467963 [Stipitochalara longipes BDJ]|nr:hypothetical protein N431DRAFT_467963 [Stipitochalara longipes BDJ]